MARLARLLAVTASASLMVSAAAAQDARRPVLVVGTDQPGHPLVHYVAAHSADYFKDRPYDVRFRLMSTRALSTAFARGDVHAITAGIGDLPRLTRARGAGVRVVAALGRWTPGPMLIVPRDSAARRLSDLRGKLVAIPPRAQRTGHEESAVLASLEAPLRRVLRLRVRSDAAGALERREVAAAFVEGQGRALLRTGRYRAVFSVQQAYRKAFSDPAVLRTGYVMADIPGADDATFASDLRAATIDAWTRYTADPDAVARDGARWGGLPAGTLAAAGKALQLARLSAGERAVSARDVRTWKSLFPLIARAEGGSPPAPEQISALFLLTPAALVAGR